MNSLLKSILLTWCI